MDKAKTAAERDIEVSFFDATGRHRTVDSDVLDAFLKCIPEKQTHEVWPPQVIRRGDDLSALDLGDCRSPFDWSLKDQAGAVVADGRSSGGVVKIPVVEQGIYILEASAGEQVLDQTRFLSVPPVAYMGSFERCWILAVQLYGVRSSRNWGIGDFTDLKALLEWCGRAGAAGIGLNPLHVLFDDHPSDCSPYSPNSRLFLNTLYINVEGLPWYNDAFGSSHRHVLDRLREQDLVDYNAVSDIKQRELRRCFAGFKARATAKQRSDFEKFRAAKARSLRRFACFEVLRHDYKKPWWQWQEEFRMRDDGALDELALGRATDVEFVEFSQWCADMQLRECQQLARDLNLSIGLYLDVAVGVKADGFDAWNEQLAISREFSVGAPPDIWNTAGQDWGLAGFNPSGLEAANFEPFRETVAAAMQCAGAIRLDHVLGLNRLYLIPQGNTPDKGAYVRMPLETLLGIVALESMKHRCIVIGEDLGTVPDRFRERLADWGVWSYRVMMFERDHDGSFFPPDRYPENSLVTFNTHDLPTFEGWRSGHDIKVKEALEIDPGESREARIHASGLLGVALGGNSSFTAALQFMNAAPSRLLAISIEDLLNVMDQTNIPGTIDQHPNWRRKIPHEIEDWSRHINLESLRKWLGTRVSP